MKYLVAFLMAFAVLVVSVDDAEAGRRRRSRRCKPCYSSCYKPKHASHYHPVCKPCRQQPAPQPKPHPPICPHCKK